MCPRQTPTEHVSGPPCSLALRRKTSCPARPSSWLSKNDALSCSPSPPVDINLSSKRAQRPAPRTIQYIIVFGNDADFRTAFVVDAACHSTQLQEKTVLHSRVTIEHSIANNIIFTAGHPVKISVLFFQDAIAICWHAPVAWLQEASWLMERASP